MNSLSKDNFSRVRLLEAHNALFDYDIINLCETNLNNSVELPETLLENYTFISCNNPGNLRRGGVGMFYKSTLPLKIRSDLSMRESIVVELKYGNKKIFLTVLYRSPSSSFGSSDFTKFLSELTDLVGKIRQENPYSMFISGDFNGHSTFWWPNGDTTLEGREIDEVMSQLGLTQLINEPTNFEPNKNPSCIDLIFTDQPNIVLESGIRPSLDSFCHHQIIHCRTNFHIPPPPPFERRIWDYDKANVNLIRRSISNFPWQQHLSLSNDPSWQVSSFTEKILNIMSNFIPNKVVKIIPSDPPWITRPLKTMLRRQNRQYKNYKRHGFRPEDKIQVDAFKKECEERILKAKENYMLKLGTKLADPATSNKAYWKYINNIMNKCKAPRIPPFLINNIYVTNCKSKASELNRFFSNQCKPLNNGSSLPCFSYLTDKRLTNITVTDNEILSLIRGLNPSKAHGCDDVSARMITICGDSLVLPLTLIFNNILKTGIYPNSWKLANITPIHKKGDKQLIQNYRPISLLSLFGKIFEKIIFNQLYNYLVTNNLITSNQSGFRPGDSTVNQLLHFVNDIHKSSDLYGSLETRAVFLDISKAFDKVWHKGLIFKLKQNGISGPLLNVLTNYLSNRMQRVVVNGSQSNFLPIESGVPQGSVLGPLLFLVFINDLQKNIQSKIKFFADDTMLFSTVHDPDISASDLNHDLQVISKWAFQWKLSFNPDPTKQAVEMIFSHKYKATQHPPLFSMAFRLLRLMNISILDLY